MPTNHTMASSSSNSQRTTRREESVSPTGVNDSKDEELGKFCVVLDVDLFMDVIMLWNIHINYLSFNIKHHKQTK